MTIFRAATDRDWPQVAALLAACALPAFGARQHLADFILCEAQGALLGCAGAEIYGDAALLRSLAVSELRRGHGIGQLLFERMMAQLAVRGVKTVALLTTTAEGFFAERGFAVVQRADVPAVLMASEEFKGACPDSAVAMLRRL